jgi:hypothetical protein
VWVTAQAVMALAGKALPLGPVALPPASSSPHRAHSGGGRGSAAASAPPAAKQASAHRRSHGQTVRPVAFADRVTPSGWKLAAGPMTVVAAVISALGLTPGG